MTNFYNPNQEQLTRLDTPFICAYSGGKDSTCLVTWIEWLRRSYWLTVATPRLVISDTGVEYPFLKELSSHMIACLQKSGWICEEVKPLVQHKLYPSIFGRGVPPVCPAYQNMRWCSRSTKIDPMQLFRKSLEPSLLTLTGLRWGESQIRDEKLLKLGCIAGGECGIPTPGEGKYSPIINWTDCQVLDWLQGHIDKEVRDRIEDLLSITKKLVQIYGIKRDVGFGLFEPKVSMLRFGCIGCPAVSRDKVMEHLIETDPTIKHLRKLYQIWDECRAKRNRLFKIRTAKNSSTKQVKVWGPIKMKVRKDLFSQVMETQDRSGVVIITSEDETFIKQCWDNNIYPRGWSKEYERD